LDTVEVSTRLDALRSELKEAKHYLANFQTKLRGLELLASKADEIARARREVTETDASIVSVSINVANVSASLEDLAATIDNVTICGKRIAQASAVLAPVAAQAAALERAEATIAELGPRQGQLDTELAALQAELDALPEPTPPEQGPDIVRLESVLDEAQRAYSADVASLGAAEERLRQARETASRVEELRGELVVAERETADWTLLAKHLARDGIQASLVDSAGPELTDTANYLLHNCFGNRWSLFISTQRDSSDNKKRIEECEVRVVDQGDESSSSMAREGIGETFCDGEQEILNLALQLALTHLSRNAGISSPDIFLDEPATALHQKWRPQWMKMLRLASDLIGASRIYLITHLDDLKSMCDARIVLESGTARIERT
jgi:DNA repair exonuclease SbcCD ATPase subunit